jgi:hypothetical protein
MEPTGKEAPQTSQHMKGWIRGSMQRKNFKDEEYFDRELWREKNCFG